MKRSYCLFCYSLAILFGLCACTSSKPKTSVPYVSYSDVDEWDEEYSDDIVSVPYREYGGVKTIKVTLNGMAVDMIFDTGCSGTLISLAEAQYMYSKGLLTDDDILGTSHSQIADGSIVENMVINLDRIVIDEKLSCCNVKATVCLNNDAPLLLGNEVLNRAASYTIDNENKVIKFKLK
jgi:predicted aspartyl protease